MPVTEVEREVLGEREHQEKEVTHSSTKATEDIGDILAPVYEEIPPAPKAGLYLEEGLRSWAFIAISAIADEISAIEMSTFKRSKDDWVENTNNQILNSINYPNLIQTKQEMFWLLTVYLLAEGEAPLLLNNSKNPTQMVLLNPNKLKIKYDKTNVIGGYTYHQSNGQTKPIDKDLIIMVKLPNVLTPMRGTGIMKYIAQTLDIDNYVEEYIRKFFYNDATPGSVLETDKELSKEAYERLQTHLKTKHRGVKKAHKNLILEGGLKWREVGNKLSDLQLKEMQDSIRDKVLAAFKVPKSILGIVEDVNKSNGETSDRVFAKRCIRPKLKLIEAQLNMFYVSKFSDGKNYWLEFDNPVKEDEKMQAEVDEIYVRNKIWTVNEVRARMELPPIEETDATTEEMNEDTEEETGPEEGKSIGRKHWNPIMINRFKGNFEKPKSNGKKGDALANIMKDFLNMSRKAKKEYSEEDLKDYHTKKISFTEKIEADYVKAIMGFFQKAQDEIVGSFKSYNTKAIDYNLDDEEQAKAMAELSIPFIEDALIKESALAYAFMGLATQRLDPQDKLVRKFIASRTLKLGKSTAATTREDVKSIIKKWNEEEKDLPTLKTMLKEYFSDSKRADMIARTEVSRATGFAQETVYEEVGAVGKQWITAQDERLCEFCAEMDEVTASITESFFEKGSELAGASGNILTLDYEDVSSPPLHPSCRCDLIPIFVEQRSVVHFRKKNLKKVAYIKKLDKKPKKK